MSVCSIIAIGNELTRGKIVDTNSAYIASALHEAGVRQVRVSLVGDDLPQMIAELQAQAEQADLIITTGGLGPTSDDCTREAVAKSAGAALELSQPALEKLTELCRRRNREVNENNRRQVFFPTTATVITNPIGTADAFLTPLKNTKGKTVPVISIPGVPKEMQLLTDTEILPRLKSIFPALQVPRICELRVFGLPEANIGERIERLKLNPAIEVSYRPQFPEILVQLTAFDNTPLDPEAVVEALGSEFVFSRSDAETLPKVVTKLLAEHQMTLAAAESCSGGLFADAIVAEPGASEFFLMSLVAYSNAVKTEVLGVDPKLLGMYGAVSKEAAEAMAKCARSTAGADLAVSITGIAGPDGGTPGKPVGTIWVGFASAAHCEAFHLLLPWDREFNRRYSVYRALDILRRNILELPLAPSKS